MSLVCVPDPRTDLLTEDQQLHTIHTSGQRVSYDVLTADSSQQDANLISANWKIFPPSNQTIVERVIWVRSYVEVTSENAIAIANDLDTAPRQFPVSSIIRNVSVKINGETISRTLGDFLHAELCYGNEAEDRRKCWSKTCAYPDQFQQLENWRSAVEGGSARNPAGRYGENPQESLRGAFTYEVISDDVLRFVITEPVLISPLSAGIKETSGMINVNEIYLDLQYDSLSSRFMTCGERQNPPQVDGITTTFYRRPECLMCYITPSQYSRLPAVSVYPYVKPREYPLPLSNLADGETRLVRSNAIRLSQVPKSVMLFCRRQKQTATFDTPDSFLAIKRVSVNWNNETNLLSGASQQSLYDMSVRNGCNLSFQQFSKKRGSPLMLSFGRDIMLPSGLAAGVAGSFTLQVEMDVENVSGDDMLCDFYMVLYDTGSFSISQNSARASLGNLSPSMVLSAEVAGAKMTAHHHDHAVKGRSLLEDLSNMVPAHHAPVHSKQAEQKAPAMEDETGGRKVGGSLLRRR